MGCCIKTRTEVDSVGQNLEKSYKLDTKLLGSGSYAKVYRATEIKTGKVVAVKRIIKAKSKREYLDQEISIMRRFGNHKHIVSLLACFETELEVQLVIEYMSGGELFDVLNENGPYGEADAAYHLKAVGSALSFLHANHVAHRDLKPENLLLTGKPPALGVLKLSDFGLAKVLKENELMHKACGTWAYCAPEVLRVKKTCDGAYDVSCDMFSVGVLLFVILAGYHPFDVDGQNTEQQMENLIIKGTWDFNDDAWNNVSEEAKDLIRLLLEPDPARRLTAPQLLKHSWTAGVSPYGSLSMKIDSDLGEYRLRMKHKNLKAGLISTQVVARMVLGQGKHIDDAKGDNERRSEAKRRWEVIQKAHKSGELTEGKPRQLASAVKAAQNRFLRFQATPDRGEKERRTRISQLFKALDADRNGWLDVDELFRFAKLVEFPGDTVQWNKEYSKLCAECGWHAEAGIDCRTFELLLNTKECNFYHTNDMLEEILARLGPELELTSTKPSATRATKDEAAKVGNDRTSISMEQSNTEVSRKKKAVNGQGKTWGKAISTCKSKAKKAAKPLSQKDGKMELLPTDTDAPQREVSGLSGLDVSKRKKVKQGKAKQAAANEQPGDPPNGVVEVALEDEQLSHQASELGKGSHYIEQASLLQA